jgi:hypothetical protein
MLMEYILTEKEKKKKKIESATRRKKNLSVVSDYYLI